MERIVDIIVLILMLTAIGAFFYRILRGPSLADRAVGVDGLVTTIVALALILGVRNDTSAYIDIALVVAFVGFLGTIGAARFIEQRGA